jgi:hypothetical protein
MTDASESAERRRLPWQRSPYASGFIAYPDGNKTHHASISYEPTSSASPWRWSVHWPNRFSRESRCPSKQQAADEATRWWWHLVETAPPEREPERNPHEIIDEMLSAVLTKPIDFDLSARSTEWLQMMNSHIARRWEQDIRLERTPEPIAQLMRQSSEILFQRRAAGKNR